jgi:hypothetical protein
MIRPDRAGKCAGELIEAGGKPIRIGASISV